MKHYGQESLVNDQETKKDFFDSYFNFKKWERNLNPKKKSTYKDNAKSMGGN